MDSLVAPAVSTYRAEDTPYSSAKVMNASNTEGRAPDTLLGTDDGINCLVEASGAFANVRMICTDSFYHQHRILH